MARLIGQELIDKLEVSKFIYSYMKTLGTERIV